jgi:hypothetical protein
MSGINFSADFKKSSERKLSRRSNRKTRRKSARKVRTFLSAAFVPRAVVSDGVMPSAQNRREEVTTVPDSVVQGSEALSGAVEKMLPIALQQVRLLAEMTEKLT